jgi:S-DNA-T family DNA segregation ATPase FtsK/SpoIIIE
MGFHHSRNDSAWLLPIVKSLHRTLLRWRGQGVVASILDVYDALGFETRNGQTPLLVKRTRTDYGWRLIWHLPAGIPSRKVEEQLDAFEEQVGGRIVLERHGANLFMDVVTAPLPDNVPYAWEPDEAKGYLPVPIGVTHMGDVVADLGALPHILIGGNPGSGKTTFLRVLILSALRQGAVVVIIDLKRGSDYSPFERYCPMAFTEGDALRTLWAVSKELRRRYDLLRAAGVDKAQDYRGNMPPIVLVIDELAEMREKESLKELDSLARLARAAGISLAAGVQHPSHDILPKFSNTRALFSGRLCFTVPKREDSEIILGNDMASKIPRSARGRAIWQYDSEGVEVQCLNLPLEEARRQLKGLPHGVTEEVLAIERRAERLPPR